LRQFGSQSGRVGKHATHSFQISWGGQSDR
jgi:hypothetical protein